MTGIEPWRALAIERGRQIESLRKRLLAAMDSIPDEHVRAFVTALDTTRPQWLRDLDTMSVSNRLDPGEIEAVLDDLWRRAAVDTPA